MSCIAEYLKAVLAESIQRGFSFDAGKIAGDGTSQRIDVPRGQIGFEWHHLMKKLEARAPTWHARQSAVPTPLVHPLFRAIPGGVADWERP